MGGPWYDHYFELLYKLYSYTTFSDDFHVNVNLGLFFFCCIFSPMEAWSVQCLHRTDTDLNTDYLSLFTFHEIINIYKWEIYFKISKCGFRLETNASYYNVYLVLTDEMLFPGKFNKLWQNFADFSWKCFCIGWYTGHIFVWHILFWSDCVG